MSLESITCNRSKKKIRRVVSFLSAWIAANPVAVDYEKLESTKYKRPLVKDSRMLHLVLAHTKIASSCWKNSCYLFSVMIQMLLIEFLVALKFYSLSNRKVLLLVFRNDSNASDRILGDLDDQRLIKSKSPASCVLHRFKRFS